MPNRLRAIASTTLAIILALLSTAVALASDGQTPFP
jgi:hypothetical protein